MSAVVPCGLVMGKKEFDLEFDYEPGASTITLYIPERLRAAFENAAEDALAEMAADSLPF